MLIIRQEAEEEIKVAYEWYKQQQTTLAKDFIEAIETTLTRIADKPDLYPLVYKNLRRAFCSRFPYSVYFVKAEVIVIMAVLHQRHNPSFIQTRA